MECGARKGGEADFSSAFQSHVIMQSLIRFVTFPCHYRQQTRRRSFADGSGGPLALRTSPLASELPLTCEAVPFAGGASAPYLSGCARQPFIVRCAHYARGGFAHYVRLRHYRSSLFCCRKIIPSHSFAALTALIVRRVNGHGDQPMLTCASRRTPPEGALACALGNGTLPPALVVRRVNGDSALTIQ